MNDLKKQIDALKNSASKDDRTKCIPLLSQFLQENPQDAEGWYDLACCYDFLGYEKDAEPCYQKTYETGWKKLPPKEQKSFFIGFGSTLRNNLKFSASERVLLEGVKNFPEDPTLKVFLALTYFTLNRHEESARALFETIVKLPQSNFDGYEKAIAWYAIHLDSHPKKD